MPPPTTSATAVVGAADSPSQMFELLIGYVTDVTQDVQSFKVRKMDSMGDFIWADALSTKLGRIKQLAGELKKGFDDDQKNAVDGGKAKATTDDRDESDDDDDDDVNGDDDRVAPPINQRPTGSKGVHAPGKERGSVSGAAAAAAAHSKVAKKTTNASTAPAHDAESVMSKEEEIENTLMAKNKVNMRFLVNTSLDTKFVIHKCIDGVSFQFRF